MRVLRFFEGQAFEPDTLALRGSEVRLESLTGFSSPAKQLCQL